MALDEEAEKEKAGPSISEYHPNGKLEVHEEDESRIELLQWYLKMAIPLDPFDDLQAGLKTPLGMGACFRMQNAEYGIENS